MFEEGSDACIDDCGERERGVGRGESIGVRSGRGGGSAMESRGDGEVAVAEEEVKSLGDVFSLSP